MCVPGITKLLPIHGPLNNRNRDCRLCMYGVKSVNLKLYCGYKYTQPSMINRIWGLKQLLLQVNGQA